MRRSDFTLKCISAVLLIAIACYIGFYFFRSSTDLTQTSTAVIVTAGESTMTTGYIVRDEQVLSGGGSNVATTIDDGQKVANGQVIAVSYNGDSALERAEQIRTLQLKINQLEQLSKYDAGSTTTETVKSIASAVAHNSFDALEQLRVAADSCIFNIDSEVDTETELNALRLDLAQLESTSSNSTDITAPYSGTFTSVTDGYESIGLDDVQYLNPSELDGVFTGGSSNSSALGKLVKGTTWYYVCVMDSDYADRLQAEEQMQLNFSKTYSGSLKMNVESIGAQDDGKCLVIFSCNTALADTISIRTATAEVMFSENTGILVAKSAVHLDDEDNAFVYILTGSQLETAYINILCEYQDSYIVESSSSSGSYLREGCEIVVKGNGLFDGKVID
jgi:hypothetical protein